MQELTADSASWRKRLMFLVWVVTPHSSAEQQQTWRPHMHFPSPNLHARLATSTSFPDFQAITSSELVPPSQPSPNLVLHPKQDQQEAMELQSPWVNIAV
jgi:hypothetical protein